MVESRYTDQTIVKCHTCGWIGRAEYCRHGYIADGGGDAAPQDYCSVCESIDLEDEPVEEVKE